MPVVHTLASCLAVAKYPTKNDELSSYIAAAAHSAKIAGRKAFTAARAADTVDTSDADDTASIAADTVSHAAQDAGSNIPIYAFAAADARLVNDGGSALTLANQPLRIDRTFEWASGLWPKLRTSLHNLENGWDVWTRWYDAVLEGKPTPGGEELDIFRVKLNSEADWRDGPIHVNALIKAKEDEIAARVNFSASTSITSAATGELSAVMPEITELEVPAQTSGALVFGSAGDGPIDVIKIDGANRILDTADARDSHSEVVRFITVLIELHESGRESPNNGNALAYQEGLLLRESLGLTIKDVRPGLLIPRGEALRQRLSRNVARDELSDAAPLSDSMESAVSNVVKAYNAFVGLDPELSKRDESSFGPDAERNLVPPDKGQELVKSARESGVITVDAESAINAEGKVAPSQPDPANRLSRRFSEGTKNLFRATIGRAVRWVKENLVVSSAGTGLVTAKWVLANEQWLLKFFADHPAMLEVLNWLLSGLKALPLG